MNERMEEKVTSLTDRLSTGASLNLHDSYIVYIIINEEQGYILYTCNHSVNTKVC